MNTTNERPLPKAVVMTLVVAVTAMSVVSMVVDTAFILSRYIDSSDFKSSFLIFAVVVVVGVVDSVGSADER